MLVRNLPTKIFDLWMARASEQDMSINNGTVVDELSFHQTSEGVLFWHGIDKRNFDVYDKQYPHGHENPKPKPGDVVDFKVSANHPWDSFRPDVVLLCYSPSGIPWIVNPRFPDRAKKVYAVRAVPPKVEVTMDELLTTYTLAKNIKQSQISVKQD